MRGLLPRRPLFLFIVERVLQVVELVEGGALFLPADQGPYLPAR
jgi:hypothetical protein